MVVVPLILFTIRRVTVGRVTSLLLYLGLLGIFADFGHLVKKTLVIFAHLGKAVTQIGIIRFSMRGNIFCAAGQRLAFGGPVTTVIRVV